MNKRKLLDYTTHRFSLEDSRKIRALISEDNLVCRFCGGKLGDFAYYYAHENGWETTRFIDKIWIWFRCSKCGHEWSLSHLRVPRSSSIDI